VKGVEVKGVGSGWSRQTCQLHTSNLCKTTITTGIWWCLNTWH